jgi:haloalkane dehalogenase
MLAYGLEDRGIAPEWAMADFRLLFPKAPVVQLPGVGHFCQEDAPETLTAMIHQFIQANR